MIKLDVYLRRKLERCKVLQKSVDVFETFLDELLFGMEFNRWFQIDGAPADRSWRIEKR